LWGILPAVARPRTPSPCLQPGIPRRLTRVAEI
jgi:hypothetical protein